MIVSLLGVVILLYAALLPRPKENKRTEEELLDAVGDALQQFASEMEQENQDLHRMVGEMKREHEQYVAKLMARIESLERENRAGGGTDAPGPAVAVRQAEAAPARPAASPAPVGQAAPPIRFGPSRGAYAERTAPSAAYGQRQAEAEAAVAMADVEGAAKADAPDAGKAVEAAAPAAEALPQAAPPAERLANTIKARYKELFDLYDSGKSIEYIAKKLGRNKGEVQLILGLAKQEEPQHGRS